MDTKASGVAVVQRMRTFADDARRAKERQEQLVEVQLIGTPLPAKAKDDGPAPVMNIDPGSIKPLNTWVNEIKQAEVSHLADDPKPLDIRKEAGEVSQEGTIIKDTRKRWSLGKAIGESLTAWVDEKKDVASSIPSQESPVVAAQKTEAPKPPPKVDLKASDDPNVLVEGLRTFAIDTERATKKSAGGDELAIKQARKTIRPPQFYPRADSSLSQITNDLAQEMLPSSGSQKTAPKSGFAQREDVVLEPIVPKSTPTAYGLSDDIAPTAARTSEMPAMQMPKVRASIVEETPIVVSSPLPSPVIPASPAPSEGEEARKAAIEQLLAMRAQHVEKEPEPAVKRDIEFTLPTFDRSETSNFRTYRDDAIQEVEQNQRSVQNIAAAEAVRRTRDKAPMPSRSSTARPFVISAVVMIVIIIIGGFGFLFYRQSGVVEDGTVARIPTFITIETQKAVPIDANRATLLAVLRAEVTASPAGITQIYLTDASAEGFSAAVTTSAFMYVLDPRAPGSFIRNLSDEMMFGAYNNTDPFFILKTKQFDSAFAGMITWEQYMSADLSPLFGNPVERTKDDSLRTVDQTRSAFFTDDTVRDVDVRVLKDETGTERILYAFPDKSTILITTSRTALIELIERLRQ